MRSMRSVQRRVGLRQLGNQLPVLGKANSFCKSEKKLCFYLFVKLGLSLRRARNRIPGYRSSGKMLVASRRCNQVPVAPLAVKKYTHSRFFVRSIPPFRSLMLTAMPLRVVHIAIRADI